MAVGVLARRERPDRLVNSTVKSGIGIKGVRWQWAGARNREGCSYGPFNAARRRGRMSGDRAAWKPAWKLNWRGGVRALALGKMAIGEGRRQSGLISRGGNRPRASPRRAANL